MPQAARATPDGAGAGFQSPQPGSKPSVPFTWAKTVTVSAASVKLGKQD